MKQFDRKQEERHVVGTNCNRLQEDDTFKQFNRNTRHSVSSSFSHNYSLLGILPISRVLFVIDVKTLIRSLHKSASGCSQILFVFFLINVPPWSTYILLDHRGTLYTFPVHLLVQLTRRMDLLSFDFWGKKRSTDYARVFLDEIPEANEEGDVRGNRYIHSNVSRANPSRQKYVLYIV